MDDYYDLTNNSIDGVTIVRENAYNCSIRSTQDSVSYKGFLLARSEGGKAMTVCDVDFQRSPQDSKYHPRLTFKRINDKGEVKKVNGNALQQRISFQKGQDGYRAFWDLVSFLYGFSEIIDTGTFKSQYRVATKNSVIDYLGQTAGLEEVMGAVGADSASLINYLTTIRLLTNYREKIQSFITDRAKETEVQNWLDEDGHKHRKDRCMIFGLEYVNHKREGGVTGNRYDLLTRIGFNNQERVLIELKSPGDSMFEVKELRTVNDSKTEYSISSALSRAIPQILEYKKDLEDKSAGDAELEKMGEENPIVISRCIIVIGADESDARWKKNKQALRNSLSSGLEIWTYSDLLHKIDSTIYNLNQRES